MTTDRQHEQYLQGLKAMFRQQGETLEKERLDLLERIRPAGPALRELGAKEVILFGSILRPGEFDRASDIDILVSGLDDEKIWHVLGTVERAVSINSRTIDIVFEQMASYSLIMRAREHGIKL